MMSYGKEICAGLIAGKLPCQIARENGISAIWVKKRIAQLVEKGIVRRQSPYVVRADYEEVLRNGKKS